MEAPGTQLSNHRSDQSNSGIDRDRLVAAHHAAVRFFAGQLAAQAGASPREYLRLRGIEPLPRSTRWDMGYAPPSWNALTNHLRDCGFDANELLTAGLAVRTRRGGLVDRFRDRIVLTVHDLAGQPVGFVGRAAPRATSDTPKYLNSPRTPLFDKGALLFGLAEQQDALAAGAVPVIVEGPFDALAVSLADQESPTRQRAAIAPCGTALTAAHAATLAHLCDDHVLVAFDSDPAGQRASAAAYDVLAPLFAQLRGAVLPEGCDPAALLQAEGARALSEILSQDRPLADAVMDEGLRYWVPRRDNAEAKAAAVHELAPRIARLCPPDVARETVRLAQALEIDHRAITEAVADAVTRPRSTARQAARLSTTPIAHRRPALSLDLS